MRSKASKRQENQLFSEKTLKIMENMRKKHFLATLISFCIIRIFLTLTVHFVFYNSNLNQSGRTRVWNIMFQAIIDHHDQCFVTETELIWFSSFHNVISNIVFLRKILLLTVLIPFFISLLNLGANAGLFSKAWTSRSQNSKRI